MFKIKYFSKQKEFSKKESTECFIYTLMLISKAKNFTFKDNISTEIMDFPNPKEFLLNKDGTLNCEASEKALRNFFTFLKSKKEF